MTKKNALIESFFFGAIHNASSRKSRQKRKIISAKDLNFNPIPLDSFILFLIALSSVIFFSRKNIYFYLCLEHKYKSPFAEFLLHSLFHETLPTLNIGQTKAWKWSNITHILSDKNDYNNNNDKITEVKYLLNVLKNQWLNWTNVCFHHLLNNLEEGEINEQTTFLLFLFFYVPQRQSAQKWKIIFEISSQVKTGFLPDTLWNSFLILWMLLITDVYVLFLCIYKQNSFGIGFCLTSFTLRNASNTSFH